MQGLLLAVLLAGPAAAAAPRLPYDYLPVPLLRQAATWSCGPAALQAILYYFSPPGPDGRPAGIGFDSPESHLYAGLGTTEQDGTEPGPLAAAAQAYGLRVELREGVTLAELRLALAWRMPVILDIQAWPDDGRPTPWTERWDDGHYAVLVGMDEAYAYFMDPSTGASYTYIPLPELLDRWHDVERTGRRFRNLAIFVQGGARLSTLPGPLLPLR